MLLAGVDEVGRGALAGPVTTAAVILPENYKNPLGIKDSKALTHQKRLLLFEHIKSVAIAYSIQSVSVDVIEEINILKATMKGMQLSLDDLNVKPDSVLIDGNYSTIVGYDVTTQVKADSSNITVAAASILAKVTRDLMMIDLLHRQFPIYNWNRNKGYATLEHRNAILENGICPIHRISFCKKILQQRENERLF